MRNATLTELKFWIDGLVNEHKLDTDKWVVSTDCRVETRHNAVSYQIILRYFDGSHFEEFRFNARMEDETQSD